MFCSFFSVHQLIQIEREWCTKAHNVDVHVDAITYDLLINRKFDCQKSNRNVHPLTFSVIFRFIIEFKQFAAWACSLFYSSFCCAWFSNTIIIMRNVQYILTSSLRLHLFEHHFGIHHMNVDWHDVWVTYENVERSYHRMRWKFQQFWMKKKTEENKSTKIEVLTFERKIACFGWISRLQCLYTLYIEESLNGFQADCSYFGHATQAIQHWNAEACSPFVVDFCFSFVTQNIASMRKYFPFIYSDTKQKETTTKCPIIICTEKKWNGRQGRIGYIDEAIILKYQVLLLQSNSQAFFHKNVETTNGRKRLRITNLRAKSEEKSRKTKRTKKKNV